MAAGEAEAQTLGEPLLGGGEEAVPSFAREDEGARLEIDGEGPVARRHFVLLPIFVGDEAMAAAPVSSTGLRKEKLLSPSARRQPGLKRRFKSAQAVPQDEVHHAADGI